MIIARLNAKLGPIGRGDQFEDPLQEALKERETGEVTGGGTMLEPTGEIQFCDLEIVVPAATEGVYDLLASLLEEMGAPKGSALLVDDEEVKELGTTEGLAVYLNGTDLPDATYETSDFDFVLEEFGRLLGEQKRILSVWEGATETAIYVYGPSFQEMRRRLEPFLASYPLCERCRVVQIA